jgi:acyl-CoA thioester hydrolase
MRVAGPTWVGDAACAAPVASARMDAPNTPPGPSRRTLQVRWNDIDMLGHLNQAVYHELLEEGRVGLIAGVGSDSRAFVLARVELDYRREVRFSDREVTVETGVERIGRSSVRLMQRLVRSDGTVAAEGVSVIVGWDAQARGSRVLADDERAAFERHTVPAADPAA